MAQVNIGGLAEMELRKGGADSGPTINQTPTDKWMVYTPSMRLFLNAGISDSWYVSGAIQTDYFYGYRSEVFLSSFNLNWMASENITLTAGRFITSFGRYNELLLSSENPFVHMPLTHAWHLSVDRRRGFVPTGTSYDGVEGQAMIYRRLYSQGLKLGGGSGSGNVNYQLAATLTSLSGYTDVAQQNRPAFIGHLEVQPVIWNTIGLSFSNGPYMNQDPVNSVLTDSERAGYHQTIATAYTEFSHSYYLLMLQYTFNQWDAPWIDPTGLLLEDDLEANVSHYLAKFKVRFPFWVGGYGAVRYEMMHPKEVESSDYYSNNNNVGKPGPDVTRFEFVLGYQFHRNIILKTSYLLSKNDGVDLDDDVFSIQVSAKF
jgi:hypothetical protein